jgi:uncharacterized protein YfbU (UPF0304 family)
MSETITLSKIERLMLANQFKILSVLDPDEAEYYDRVREALNDGFVSAYQDAFNQIYDGLSREDCRLVNDAFCVYDAIQRSYKKLTDTNGIEESAVGFPGFDGNNETSFMAYAEFVREREGRFDYLIVDSDGMNSHWPYVGKYRRMVEIWRREMAGSYELSREQIAKLLSIDLD